ncbi:hypothetical protein Vadar_012359 [Vaccinium darrowii]|uniref:Uncharacterized protein n=1 Tax=Vaccinium darrowii TaxID=229202 RepID=A0ACB7Y7L1_9ERIC|nr:hypothetical protein Vadar_012359 [Vaccinium darrowii]
MSLEKFRKGTVTIAGDAMHVMGPFLGQGGSAALEDTIVLARCLSHKFVNRVDHLLTSESETTRMMCEVWRSYGSIRERMEDESGAIVITHISHRITIETFLAIGEIRIYFSSGGSLR